MNLERLFRDLAYAAGCADPGRAMAAMVGVHGDPARRFGPIREGLVEQYGPAGAQKFAEDMAVMAASAAIEPVRDVDPLAAYQGYLYASRNPQRFSWWLEDALTPHAGVVRSAAARTSASAPFESCARQVPIRAWDDFCSGLSPTAMLGITEQTVADAAGGLVLASAVAMDGVAVHVSGSDCPISRSRSFEGLEIACRTASDLTGCAHFRGVGGDGHVRCAAQRVAQTAPGLPTNPMAPSPKPGDMLEIDNTDGSKTKVKITRIDPDQKVVVEPTLG